MPYENTKIMLDRAKNTLNRLRDAIYESIGSLRTTAWVTKEPVAYENRMSGVRKSLQPGDQWGELWDCAWFHFEGEIPAYAVEPGNRIVLLIDVNGELCLVDEEGSPRQGLTNINSEFELALGLPGKRVVDLQSAETGQKIDLWADAGCNDLFGSYRSGTLKEAQIAICREWVRKLYYDFEVLIELAEQIDIKSARRARVIQALYEASLKLSIIDDHSVNAAHELLQPQLDKRGGDAMLTVSAIGHAHIDLAWLWPIRETIRKGARTFSTVLRNMEKYPDYIFGASQPQLYQWMKEYDPKLYAQIGERVREGRWELQGAMWVEPDTNISGGEALVRQILYGKRFFRQEFGQDVRTLWLPDVFGYSGSLPQLLRKSGVDYMMTQKLSWSVYNTHPHHSFFWEGIDGSRILTHLPPEDTYNGPAAPRSLAKIEQSYLDKNVSEHALMLFGIGDGGGGPGEEHLERLTREHNLLGLPPVVQEYSVDFFHKLESESEKFETYRGELYLEKHQGTLTSQARNKRYNRKMEKALRELEFTASMVLALDASAENDQYPTEALDRIWKEMLLYQFHDILPGSSITRVFDESLERYAALYAETMELLESAQRKVLELQGGGDGEDVLAEGGTLLLNSLPWTREEVIEHGGEYYRVSVPSMGYAVLSAEDRVDVEAGAELTVGLVAQEQLLENKKLRVVFDESGAITSLVHRSQGALGSELVREREMIAPGAKANVLTVYHDRGDAWDFARDYRDTVAGVMELEESQAYIEGNGAVLEQKYVFGQSSLTQKIILEAGSDVLRFETVVNWNEDSKMLRASFPVQIMSDHVNCEIQFGMLKRPTTRNNAIEFARDEICAHQYIDLSQPDYGIALLSDSKYGYSAEGHTLDINLLRSPSYPDPVADRAEHEFVYALYPHAGDMVQSGVYRKGYELNTPIAVFGEGTAVNGAGRTAFSWIEVEHPNVMIEAVKKAEDSNHLIVRLYETSGTDAKAQLKFATPCAEITETDLMEQPLEPDSREAAVRRETSQIELAFTPFEIKTLRVQVK
ncbi:glycoside hydrolase family 38 C-terminal domain-containing protein [Saccharibacillus sp. JS10]|uniref:alpha-mannosidase n=1 Tax=Saccharibacillus sp. JS10 TaxID=2950552 RepID=UPI00210A93D8|nr:glycoside hydrolase family 38 C-terminal domain-containing protein [Saccharibacillus sp. JS10]MCQ4088456.1 glycosyl hydrolase-related protein [Saccharibacillus sp. JS10]